MAPTLIDGDGSKQWRERRAAREDKRRDLARIRQRLDDWRGSDKRRAALALKLWSGVGRVARRHGAYVTAHVLGLDYNTVKGIIDAPL